FLVRFVSARLSLRHIPGPPSSSFIWGEEWNLITTHLVVKFRGACGRRSLAPAHQSVRKFTSIFYETSGKLAAQTEEVEIEVTNWAGRFALDTVARATFSYDFDSSALDGLTNNENKLSSFYMRALFWIFPSMIRRVKAELGAIACKMWRDAKTSLDAHSTEDDKTLMALMSQMRTVLSAGYETWVLYELGHESTATRTLRAEISSLGDPSLDELNKYPVLNSVILETLRLHPAILENHHQIAKCNLFAFSEGPRSCIGKKFALAEIKALTVTLIQQFSFSCSHEIEPFQSFVIRPRVRGQGSSSLPLTVRRV
ncbi:cytochrome P450, partial [Mycena olivaceomarginata]